MMISFIFTITVLLGLLLVPAIEMKRKKCHKRPILVECPESVPRTCAHWNMTIATRERYVGNTGTLSCSPGYSLIGNNIITCLESGIWSPIHAICVPNDIGEFYVHAFSGSTYIFVKTAKNYQQAKESCISMCGTLVEINNNEENLFIGTVLQDLGFGYAYIGLECTNGNTYKWQSGNTTTSNMFENWIPGEPNNFSFSDCVRIHEFKWSHIQSCSSFYTSFICEFRFD